MARYRDLGIFAILPPDATFDAAFNSDGRPMARRCMYSGAFNNSEYE